ncbi:DnaJ domain-containing protein [Candidatus Woesearchaeota archaeon]|nr:DnaJ domain-containing protein [Candidatus Woesearchaeota archaeon]
MAAIKIKMHEFDALSIKDSFDRRALQYKNRIVSALRKIGIKEDDVDIELEPVSVKSAPASAFWYIAGHRLHYSYKSPKKYNALLAGQKTQQEFISEFSEGDDFEDKRKEAREILGVAPDALDLDHIDSKYKDLAKKCHPDMPGGNADKFKEINRAHKILKRELQ